MARKEQQPPHTRSAFELYLEAELYPARPAKPSRDLHPADPCPECQDGRMDYDSLLNLRCEACGFTLAGCFT